MCRVQSIARSGVSFRCRIDTLVDAPFNRKWPKSNLLLTTVCPLRTSMRRPRGWGESETVNACNCRVHPLAFGGKHFEQDHEPNQGCPLERRHPSEARQVALFPKGCWGNGFLTPKLTPKRARKGKGGGEVTVCGGVIPNLNDLSKGLKTKPHYQTPQWNSTTIHSSP
jgi:hypothetical protein